ncbi:MAG: DNA internalization-related competence protein ComEC/Rec2 [Pseudomonadota bacterium]
MRLATLAFLLGILLCQTLTFLPDTRWTILIIPLIILVWLLPPYRLLFFLLLGFLWTVWRADIILAKKLPKEIEGQTITITGTIIGLPQQMPSCGWRFNFAPLPSEKWPNPGHLRLNWFSEPEQPLRPGQQWQLTVRLKPAHGTLNPGGFDYSKWLFKNRILTTGLVQDYASKPRLLNQPLEFNIDNWRYRLAKAIQHSLGEQPSTGILIALAVGERQWVTQEQRTVLERTGTAHLIAISGLHIGLITLFAIAFFWIVRRGLRLYPSKAMYWLPAPRFAALLSLLAAFYYALMAGFSLPTQRAFIMVAVAVSGIIFARQVAVSHLLALALLFVLLWDPLSVLSAGFWLSFGAVAAILYALKGKRDTGVSSLNKWGINTFRTQWAVTLGMFPIVLAIFSYIPLTSLPANMVAIAWVSFVIAPLTLLGTALILVLPTLGSTLLQFAANTFEALWVFTDWLAKWSVWQQHTPPLWTIIAAMLGVAILLLPRGFPARWLGILWILPIFFTPPAHPQRGEVWFTLLDVGQGLAAVIRTENYVLVYDTGPKFCSGFNTGKAVVVPFLRAKGLQQVDKLLISHADNDHIGGAQSVLENLEVEQVLSSAPQKIKEILSADSKILSCQTGQHWQWDGVEFQILHPPANYIAKKRNDYSCVLKVSSAGGTLLLAGDIEKNSEYYLVRHHRSDLAANILVVPHHGSQTSSTESFIEAVNPSIALFSTGYLNRFGHPKKEIVQRYRHRKISVWDTVPAGAISFRLSAAGISAPSLAREEMRRYWHD